MQHFHYGWPKRAGEQHPRHKLTWEQVRAIRATYAAGGVSTTQLARRYGMSQQHISNIIVRRYWKEEARSSP